ncbi:acyltransferase family protein [Pseudomonas izuensis]|uniref:Acyltransferase family protein n=1 Tax=Pseudomonas izuensis TaxID=2684212 RepID=A0ABM7RYR7_9PSED|nr:acyltransferase [Pseudomonas izuensis]BCX67272.1 acyltransferase family protein [Pseudomonas izuensis]
MEGRGKIEFANTLRGFAAIFVLVSHYFGVFWLNRSATASLINAPELPLETHAVPNYISLINSWHIFNAGAFGVALFFLISGFVIPFSFKRLGGLEFIFNRGFRIVPTYVVGFSLSLLSVWAIGKYFSVSWPFSLNEVLIHYVPGLRDILWSKNIDGIIWTLEIEVKFYVVCALIAWLFKSGSKCVFVAPVVLFVACLYLNSLLPGLLQSGSVFYTKALALLFSANYIVFMFIGVVFHYAHKNIIDDRSAIFGVALLFGAFAYLWQDGPNAPSFFLIWNYGLALLLFSFAYAYPALFSSTRIFDFLANISYPLYVIHGVFGYALLRVFMDFGMKAWLSLVIVTAVAISVSWLLHAVVEMPSQKIGKYVLSFLFKRVSREPADAPQVSGIAR